MNFKRHFTFHSVQIISVTTGLMVIVVCAQDHEDTLESSFKYFPFLYLFGFQSCRYSHSLWSLLGAEGLISSHLISISLSLGLYPETLGERRILDRDFPCGGSLWYWVSLEDMKALTE